MKLARKLALGGGLTAGVAVAVAAVRAVTSPARLPAVSREDTTRAVIPGIPDARYWVAIDTEPFVRDVLAARRRERELRVRSGLSAELPPVELLAISGGGDKGAFGAGLLNGWTAAGTRPVFKAVTGISTGALIAPVAFLGPAYDDALRQEFTEVGADDVMKRRSLLSVFDDDALADNAPLGRVLAKHVDQAMLDAIAEEHRKGRMLLIGTTDLDARQPVIWNMGKIAASGAPGAVELFRSIMLASAAIPGALPPSMIRVEVDGVPHEEMHVDGGASAQVFLYPPSVRADARSMGEAMTRAGRVYIIRNAPLDPTWNPAPRRTFDIAARAVGALLQTQGAGDLYRIHQTALHDHLDFNLAFIGPDFEHGRHRQFDMAYMNALYDYGYALAREGYPWRKEPPLSTGRGAA